MIKRIDNIVAVIPSLEPDDRLSTYINDLRTAGFTHIVVVDDGSSELYQPIFSSLDAVVLYHEVNKGKGAALKTGYRWIQKNLTDIQGVITADSDGQHTVADCIKLATQLRNEQVLLLGARDFNLPNIPPKSKSGNKITSVIFKLLYGQYLQDTQTGLRAFPASLLPLMIEVDGDRYEYEMKVLIACSRARIPMISIPIETMYENNNEGTHFHPIRDSWRIYKVIFGSFFKFMGSSLVSMLVDQGLFNLLNLVIFANGDAKRVELILASTVTARIVSAVVNFTMNRNLIFGKTSDGKKSFGKYVILCIGIMLLSAGGTWLLSAIGMSSTFAKIIVDTLLYFVSYRVQEQWVFTKE